MPIAADIPLYADKLLLDIDWLTNSILVSLLVVGIVFFFARRASGPGGVAGVHQGQVAHALGCQPAHL
jgi:hypothetical protein